MTSESVQVAKERLMAAALDYARVVDNSSGEPPSPPPPPPEPEPEPEPEVPMLACGTCGFANDESEIRCLRCSDLLVK